MSWQGIHYEIIFQATEGWQKKKNSLFILLSQIQPILLLLIWVTHAACAHSLHFTLTWCTQVSEYLIEFSATVFSDVHSTPLVICQFQPLWPVQGDPGFPKKNDEDNCFIPEENVYQQIGYRKNRGALLMWFRARLGTSHKMDSFALQKYMGWIARRFNGESARHYFQPCFTYSLLFVKRPLRHSMARCHMR